MLKAIYNKKANIYRISVNFKIARYSRKLIIQKCRLRNRNNKFFITKSKRQKLPEFQKH